MTRKGFTPNHYFPSGGGGTGGGVPRWAIIGIFLIMTTQMVAAARAFLMPVLLGILLFFVFSPLRRWLMRRGLGSGATAGAITLGLLLAVAGLGYVVSGPVSTLVQNSSSISQKFGEKARQLRSKVRPLQEAADKLDELSGGGATDVPAPGAAPPSASAPPPPAGQPMPAGATGAGANATVTIAPLPGTDGSAASGQHITVTVDARPATSVSGRLMALGPEIVSQTLFTLLLMFFLLEAGDLLYLKIVQSFPQMKDKRAAYLALREIEDSLGAYLGAITLINALLGVAMALAMWAWGMPSPVLFGIAMFVSNYVPYIGAILIFAVSGVVGMFVYDDLLHPFLIAMTSLALTSAEGQLITPYFVSRRLQLNTVVVFLTVALWAWLWSVIGMIVAVPVLVVLRVLTAHVPGMEKFANFLAGEAPPELEGGEEEEARAVVEAGGEEADTGQAAEAVARVEPVVSGTA